MAYEARFHDAATDGYMDLLREATKRELNQANEDGVTPTHCAAASGRVDALRVIIGRGGNPDKADYLGQTALHHAAMKGHFDCVTYLVNWGCSIWALDNSGHDAFLVSSEMDRKDIMDFLDRQRSEQILKNRKTTERLKEKAITDHDRNVKRYEKLQQEAARKAEKENRKLREFQQGAALTDGAVAGTSGVGIGGTGAGGAYGSAGKMTIRQKLKTLASRPKWLQPSQYQANSSSSGGGRHTTAAGRRHGAMTAGSGPSSRGKIDSATFDVIYASTSSTSAAGGSGAGDRDDEDDGGAEHEGVDGDGGRRTKVAAGIFDRPGMGSVAFFKQQRALIDGEGLADGGADVGGGGGGSGRGTGGGGGGGGEGVRGGGHFARQAAMLGRRNPTTGGGGGEEEGGVFDAIYDNFDPNYDDIVNGGGAGGGGDGGDPYSTMTFGATPGTSRTYGNNNNNNNDDDYYNYNNNNHYSTTGGVVIDPDLPWNDEVLGPYSGKLDLGGDEGAVGQGGVGAEDDDDDEAYLTRYSSLELFLITYHLEDYFGVFTREKIDLQALMLLEDDDLKALQVELGPRRKLKNAVERRRLALRAPGVMVDTRI
ncbi:Usher syndrome type-1G protein homolog [Argonauta hians]